MKRHNIVVAEHPLQRQIANALRLCSDKVLAGPFADRRLGVRP